MKNYCQKISIMLIISILLSSCMMTKTNVGSYKEEQGKEYTYAKGKQIWLLWGMIAIGRTNVSTPTDGSCAVITKRNFADILISFLTIGIVTTYTIKVMDKKQE